MKNIKKLHLLATKRLFEKKPELKQKKEMINSGWCDLWAKIFFDILKENGCVGAEIEFTKSYEHFWVKYNNKYYDSDVCGAICWKMLPANYIYKI